MNPILLLEINEVPWRLIDRYIDDPRFPNLKTFFAKSAQFTSVAVDSGELSPWVTWPSLHRGMSNEQHGVLDLGQDPATFRGTPIWKDMRDAGHSIGICGSMQSWPAIDPGPGGFYIPDTFAHDERCIPDYVSPLQAFNLGQVQRNGRVIDRRLPSPSALLTILSSMRRSGVRLSTIASIAASVAKERIDRRLIARRPIYQTLLFWDVFVRHFDPKNPPALSTFFTNHIAGVMHRYWRDVFPEDFPDHVADDANSQEPLMCFALGVLDRMLGKVMAWSSINPKLVVVFASSMGQNAVHRDSYEGEQLLVSDLDRLMKSAGAEQGEFERRLAMVPQVAAAVADPARRATIRSNLEAIRTNNGTHFVSVREIGDNLSITVSTPPLTELIGRSVDIDGRHLEPADIGLRLQKVDAGTGYHIPEGALAFLDQSNPVPNRSRARIDADAIKTWLCSLLERGFDAIEQTPQRPVSSSQA
jgi:hypothetical protein